LNLINNTGSDSTGVMIDVSTDSSFINSNTIMAQPDLLPWTNGNTSNVVLTNISNLFTETTSGAVLFQSKLDSRQ